MHSATILFFTLYCKLALGKPKAFAWQIRGANFNRHPQLKKPANLKRQITGLKEEIEAKEEEIQAKEDLMKQINVQKEQMEAKHAMVSDQYTGILGVHKQQIGQDEELGKLKKMKVAMEAKLKADNGELQTKLNSVLESEEKQEAAIRQTVSKEQALSTKVQEMMGKIQEISPQIQQINTIMNENKIMENVIHTEAKNFRLQQDQIAQLNADIGLFQKISSQTEGMVKEIQVLQVKNKKLGESIAQAAKNKQLMQNAFGQLRNEINPSSLVPP